MTNLGQLPPEVVKALEMGGVPGIDALRSISGLSLYDAKLVIDTYLQRHPEHPLSQRMREAAQVQPHNMRGLARQDEIATAGPLAGEAVAFDLLPREVVEAECYVLLREKSNCEYWLGEVFKACARAMVDMHTIEVVDEERRSNNGEISAAVLKLGRPLSGETIQALSKRLQRGLPSGVSFRVVDAAHWNDAAIPRDELAIEYFLHEFSRNSPMIGHTTSCVKLTHRPTGIICRSTAHRRRARNYEEALLLLASLLKEVR